MATSRRSSGRAPRRANRYPKRMCPDPTSAGAIYAGVPTIAPPAVKPKASAFWRTEVGHHRLYVHGHNVGRFDVSPVNHTLVRVIARRHPIRAHSLFCGNRPLIAVF